MRNVDGHECHLKFAREYTTSKRRGLADFYPELLSYAGHFVVQWAMGDTIQARLDPQSRKKLAALVRAFGWTPSRIVREGIRVLEQTRLRKKSRAIIGLGKFDSGISDLATNKKHLKGYGR